jgi:hypothetical protein
MLAQLPLDCSQYPLSNCPAVIVPIVENYSFLRITRRWSKPATRELDGCTVKQNLRFLERVSRQLTRITESFHDPPCPLITWAQPEAGLAEPAHFMVQVGMIIDGAQPAKSFRGIDHIGCSFLFSPGF